MNSKALSEQDEFGIAIVNEARRWIGTPYRHQCTTIQQGTDCLGLIRGIWRALYGDEPLSVPAYSMDWSEQNNEEILMQVADQTLNRVHTCDMKVGDVLLFRMRDGCVAKHLGVVSCNSSSLRFIHAYSGHGVVESSLSEPWARRIAAVFRFPKKDI